MLLLLALGCDRASNGPTDLVETCDVESVPPAALRLLTRDELDATVVDLLDYAWDGTVGAECVDHVDCTVAGESCSAGVCRVDRCDVGSFWLADEGFTSVHVSGEFNGWPQTIDDGGWPLEKQGDVWVGKFDLYVGGLEYKLVVNESEWWTDPNRSDVADDGFGGWNSVITVDCDSDEALVGWPSRDWPAASAPSGFHFDNAASGGLVSSSHMTAALELGSALAPLAVDDALVGCTACQEFTIAFGERAFRRPLTSDELSRYDALRSEHGAEAMVTAMVASPHFLYRPEIGDVHGRLTGYETASALSYLFWGSMPDDALLAAAEAGDLDSAAGVEVEARRLLASPRSQAALERFTLQWLGVDALETATRDLDASTRAALMEESARFVTEVVLSGDVYAELVTADWTVGDARVARHYGVSVPDGWDELATDRSGVLGQAAVLSATAHSDQTSPVRRGLFVRERLLCQDLGTPPADAGGVPDVDPSATTRERFEQHSDDPFCASCHDYIDPIGFGFEHYDQDGRWRDSDAGQAIDASGAVLDVEWEGSDAAAEFSSIQELGDILGGSDAGPACFSTQVHRFATGAEVDGCGGFSGPLDEGLIQVACSEVFLMRERP